jgi:hypothetical protein
MEDSFDSTYVINRRNYDQFVSKQEVGARHAN